MSDEMVLSARLELKDNMTATVGKTEKSLKGMERSASSAGSAVEAMAGRGNSALQSLAGGANSVDQSLSKLSRPHDVIISARDMATPAISSVARQVGGLDKSVLVNVDVDVSGADEVSALSGELDSLSDASVSAAADTKDSTDKIKASGGSIRETFSAGAAAVGGYMMSIGQRIKAGVAAGKEGLATLSNGMNTVKSAGSGLMMMGLGGFGIAEMAGSAINAGHNLYMMATRMHIATGEAAQLSRVTSMAGVDTNTFMRSMMRLDGQAAKQGKTQTAAQAMLEKYGVSLADADGKLKPMNDQLSELAKGYKAASAAGEDEEFIMNTLGARGMALVPVLENLSEYKDIAGGVQGIGLDPQQAEETWREMQKLKLQAGQIGLVMANAFMPLAKDVFPLLNDQFKGAAKFFSDHKDVASAAARVATYGLELMAAAKAAQLLFGVLKAGAGLISTPFKIFSAIAGGGGKAAATTAASAAGAALSRDMVVNARTVVVNGAIGAGGIAAGASRGKIQDIFLKAQQDRAAAPAGFWSEAKAGIREIPGMAKSNVKGNVAMATVAAAMDIAFSDNRQKAVAESIGMVGGTAAGTAVGTAVGGAIGSIVPIIGTSIGGMIGGMLGGMAGGYVGGQGGDSVAEKWHLGQQTEKTNPDFVDHIMEKSREPETQDYDLTKGLNPALMPKKEEDWSTQYDLKKTLRQNAHQDAYKPPEQSTTPSSDYLADYQQSITNQRETGQMPGTPSYAFQFPLPGSGGGSSSGSGDVVSGGANDAVDYTNMGISDDSVAQMQARVDELKENLSSKWQEISQDATTAFGNAQTNIGGILGTLEADASQHFSSLRESAAQHFSSLRESASQELNDLSTNAGDACNDIGQYFENASGRAQSAWGGVQGFFSGLWADLKAGAASAAQSMAASLAQAARDAEASGHGTIAYGLQKASDVAAELGGGSDDSSDGDDGGSAPTGDWTGTTSFVPAYASGGIASFSAANVAHGLAQINEHGGELVDLPTGSRIYPAATTARIIQRELDSGGSQAPVGVNITGNTFVVREEADIDKIAHRIAQMVMQVNDNYGGAMA